MSFLGDAVGSFVGLAGDVLGLGGGSGPNLEEEQRRAREEETKRLKIKEKQLRTQAQFFQTGGQGLKRDATLLFGSDARRANSTPESRLLASEGRFKTDRLIL